MRGDGRTGAVVTTKGSGSTMRCVLRYGISLVLAYLTEAHAGTPVAGWADTAYVSGLNDPTALAFLPDGRLLITQKGGTGAEATSTSLLLFDGTTVSIAGIVDVCVIGEEGLLGVAVDPRFTETGFLYLYRTVPVSGACADAHGSSQAVNQIVRVRLRSDGTLDPASVTVLLDGIVTGANGLHSGGGLRMGPDSKLYVSVGDTHQGDNQGEPGSSTNVFAQDLTVLNGKVLRLDLTGAIPADNPFVGRAGVRPEIFAYGFRNPWRFGFDPQTGRLWLGDPGDFTWEEIDIVVGGTNHGWPYCEGTQPAGCTQDIRGDDPIGMPVLTYPHSGSGLEGEAVIGGAFAPTSGPFAQAGLGGDYFFADLGEPGVLSGGTLWHAAPTTARDGITSTPTMIVSAAANPVEVVFGPDGALYYATFMSGEVRRVTPLVVSTTSSSTSTSSSSSSSSTSSSSSSSSTSTSSSPSSSSTSSTTSTVATSSTTLPCRSARCLLESSRTGRECGDQAIPVGVTRRLDRAARLIERASSTSRPNEARNLRGRAGRMLATAAGKASRAANAPTPRLSADCAATLADAVARVRSGLQA